MKKLFDSLCRHTYQQEGMWNTVTNVVLPLLTILLVLAGWLGK